MACILAGSIRGECSIEWHHYTLYITDKEQCDNIECFSLIGETTATSLIEGALEMVTFCCKDSKVMFTLECKRTGCHHTGKRDGGRTQRYKNAFLQSSYSQASFTLWVLKT